MSTGAYVYRALDEAGSLLYVGSTDDPQRRMEQHRDFAPWWTPNCRFLVTPHPSIADARLAEREAIAAEHPRWNVHGRSPEHPDGPALTRYDVARLHPHRHTPEFTDNPLRRIECGHARAGAS